MTGQRAPATRRGPCAHVAAAATTLCLPGAGTAAAGDAQLIRLAECLTRTEVTLRAPQNSCHTAEDERRAERDVDRLYGERHDMFGWISELRGPVTHAGACALTSAVLACVDSADPDERRFTRESEWLALSAVQFVAGSIAP